MKSMQQYLDDYERLMTLKNYATSTRKLYLNAVRQFWRWCEIQAASSTAFDKTNAPILYLSERMKTKEYTTVNAEYSGIKQFYTAILDRPWNMGKIPRPRREKPLPVILSKEEVELLITHAGSFRNQVMLTMIYATGLRLGEVARLKIVDINSHNNTIHVHNGKGAKDRILPLAPDLVPLLRDYYVQYRPVEYLFNGDGQSQPLSHRMIQHVVASARHAAGIKRQASVHTLRHCYATHFYQHGSNGIALQIMLGHKNFKTTTRYIHLSGDYYRHLHNPASDLCKRLSSPSQPSSTGSSEPS